MRCEWLPGTIGAESHCRCWHEATDDDIDVVCCWCGSTEDDSGSCAGPPVASLTDHRSQEGEGTDG